MFGLGARESAVAAILGTHAVRGLPHDLSMTIDGLVDLALTGLPTSRADLTVHGNAVVVSVSDPHSAGVIAQRLVSLAVAHGMTIDVRAS